MVTVQVCQCTYQICLVTTRFTVGHSAAMCEQQDMLHIKFIEETLVATSNADSKREEEAFASAAKKYVQSKR